MEDFEDTAIELNSNIRCIEIYNMFFHRLRLKSLNSNIRCIEIHISSQALYRGEVE